ncbi:permease-like cell division protein FtsX [Streptacidiphilus sp. N1-12]|uniref:Permease-like cell division protein FtsX n=2 Tax=Streptacidiphilus alkalitolerans TaxID=3342712 RepID=A0ABV6V949_9ACTN
MRAQFVISEIGIGLRRNLTMTIAVVISVALSLSLAGAALLLRDQVDSMQKYWDGRVEVSVFFCAKDDMTNKQYPNCASGPATQSQMDAVSAQLEKTGLIQHIYPQTPDQQLTEYKQEYGKSSLASYVNLDAFGGALRLKLKDPRQYVAVTELVNGQPGVAYAEDQSELLKPLFKLLNGAQVVALVVMAIMLSVTLLLIVNTVRVSAFSRKRETGIMRLVGASNYYVQLPFIAEAAFAALVGAILASGMLALGKYLLIDRFLRSQIKLINFIGWNPVFQVMPLMLVLGVGMAAIAAFLTLRKYLKV